MFSVLSIMFLTVVFHCSLAGKKTIDITIMVPGVKAFEELAKLVDTIREDLNQTTTENLDTFEYEDAIDDSSDYDASGSSSGSGYNADYSGSSFFEFNGDQVTENCISKTSNQPNIICIHDINYYYTYPWSYLFVKPALDIALKTIEGTNNLLDGHQIILHYYDSSDDKGKVSSRVAQIAAVESRMNNHMSFLIGPMNAFSMSHVLTSTNHWNVLHMTSGAISSQLRVEIEDEQINNTMVRTGPVAKVVGNCVSSIMKLYNWTRRAVDLYDDDKDEKYHYFMSEGIFNALKENIPSIDIKAERVSSPHLLQALKAQGRILLISADDVTIVDILQQASRYGFNEEYVYIIVDLENKLGPTPWIQNEYVLKIEKIDELKRIFQTAFIVTFEDHLLFTFQQFLQKMKSNIGRNLVDGLPEDLGVEVAEELLTMEKIFYRVNSSEEYFQKNLYPAFFHDSLLTLAHVINSSLSEKQSENEHATDGYVTGKSVDEATTFEGSRLLEQFIASHTFEGVMGDISFDEKGDRLLDLVIRRYDPKIGEILVSGRFNAKSNSYEETRNIPWSNGSPPPDVPKCGFEGEKCIKKWNAWQISAITVGLASLFVSGALLYLSYRKKNIDKELHRQLWKVSWNDITRPVSPNSILGGTLCDNIWFGNSRFNSESDTTIGEFMSLYVPSFSPTITPKRSFRRKRKWSSNSKKEDKVFDDDRKTSSGSSVQDKPWRGLTAICFYKDRTVVMKLSNKKKVDLTKHVLMELKHMRDITHEHLTHFLGACVDGPHACILTEYCRKGSLRDILMNEEINMDKMFRLSLMNDLVKGMSFLHGSALHCHGNLKSPNCVVDSRFVLKITDYGLQAFRSNSNGDDSDREYEKKLWTAPEVLRGLSSGPAGVQKSDVYSFGIILQEIAMRKGPFYIGKSNLSCKDIVTKVRCGFKPHFRPMLDMYKLSEDMCGLIQKCWHEEPNERPTFANAKKIVERLNCENEGNLVENLLQRLEQYALNLEGLVEERTAAYHEEKQKADELLYQMLPVPVVNRLKRGELVPAEAFESVTICFTDIGDFAALSATSSPMQIVSFLNDLYTCFDEAIDTFDVYKVETIGDEYMLVSGLPVRNGTRHVVEIARTALALLKAVKSFRIRHRPIDQLQLRIGIHTGSCCAGVVGLKMPRYCLFGDTVNTASRMESTGMPLSIHVSESTKKLLDYYENFQLQLRGEIPIKGKGTLTTYWLMDEIRSEVESIEDNEMQM